MRLNFFVGILLAATLPGMATAADHTVQIGVGNTLTFTPANLTIQAGDRVIFQSVAGFHNAVSNPGTVTAFRCGPNGCDGVGGGNGDPGAGTWSQTVTFPTAGTIGYFCEVHDGQGMTGVIQVNPVPVTLQSFDID